MLEVRDTNGKFIESINIGDEVICFGIGGYVRCKITQIEPHIYAESEYSLFLIKKDGDRYYADIHIDKEAVKLCNFQ